MDTRTTILNRATELFAARGYDAVGVQEIVEAAGVSKPTLYHHFGSKRGVLAAIANERLMPFVRAVTEAARYDGDLAGTLRRVAQTYFDFAHSEPVLFRLPLVMWLTAPENEGARAMAPVMDAQRKALEELFRRASADHGNMRGRHALYATLLLGAINGVLSAPPASFDLHDDELITRLIQQFQYGIYT